MPKLYPYQGSFAAGEVSPNIFGRYDQQGYIQGVKKLLNVVSDPRGPAYGRTGSEQMYTVSGTGEADMVSFRVDYKTSFGLLFTDSSLVVIPTEGEQFGYNEITNGEFLKNINGWDSDSNVEWNEDTEQMILKPDDTDNSLTSQTIYLEEPLESYTLRMLCNANGIDATDGVKIMIGTTGKSSFDLLNTTIFGHQNYYEATITPAGATSITLTIDAQINTDAEPNTSFSKIELFYDKGTVAPTVIASPYLARELKHVQTEQHPDGLNMYFTHIDHTPYKLTYNPAIPSWTFAAETFTSKPAEWVAGNFPASMTFFQGRSWWAGCPSNPETFWGSQSNLYTIMTTGSLPSDGLRFTSSKHGLITWIRGGRNLLMGTEIGEFIITSVGGVIQPSDIEIEQQSAWGSQPIPPQEMGNETLFISPDARKLRSLYYQWTDNGYLAQDITWTNDHITKGGGIVSLTYAQNPDQIIWMTLHGGELIGCSYHRDTNKPSTFGWHRHHISDGVVLSAASIEVRGVSQLWLAVRRYVSGVPEVHAERIDLTSGVYLDGHIIQRSNTPFTVVTGLSAHEGKTVGVKADGATHVSKVVSGGQITLDVEARIAEVGLSYNQEVELLPLITKIAEGSSAAFKKNRNKVAIRVQSSALPIINGTRPNDRSPATPMGEPEPLTSGLVRVNNLGWDDEGEVQIVQDLPFPLFVSAVAGEVAMESL